MKQRNVQNRLGTHTVQLIIQQIIIGLPKYDKTSLTTNKMIMAALWNRAGHYIFALWFLLSSFFPRLISAVADWMSTILAHMVWP